jgi:hypothetical protein
MDWIFRNVWIGFIAVQCANGAAWWSRARKEIAVHPELESGYRMLVRRFVVFGNIPWIVMGFGIVYGGVPNMFHYFNPRNGPFVAAFWVTLVALWIAGGYWILIRDGADTLIRYPGLLNVRVREIWAVKSLTILVLLGGAIGFAIMMLADSPVPD